LHANCKDNEECRSGTVARSLPSVGSEFGRWADRAGSWDLASDVGSQRCDRVRVGKRGQDRRDMHADYRAEPPTERAWACIPRKRRHSSSIPRTRAWSGRGW